MPDKELPVISGKISLPQVEEPPSYQGKTACCNAEKTLTKLYGDQQKAKERCLQVCGLVKTIDEEDSGLEVRVFKALSDTTRLKILKLLMGGEMCICEIMLALKKPQSSVSHNLSVLEDAGLIKERKNGRWCHYRISDGAVIEMIRLATLFKR
jgi:DNA-binding transcriptional ArsR family regulator